MKVASYTRVSSEEQAKSGLSLESQRNKIELYSRLHEFTLDAMIVDDGESGSTLERPGMNALLHMLRTGEIEAVVIAKLDRLTRSVLDWQKLIDEFFREKAKHPCLLMSVQDSIDTRSASGRLVLNVLISVAQWEREAIAERTRDALQVKIANGERASRYPRWGYRFDEQGKMIPHKQEQAVLEYLRRGKVKIGLSVSQITRGVRPLLIGTRRPNADSRYIKRLIKQYITKPA